MNISRLLSSISKQSLQTRRLLSYNAAQSKRNLTKNTPKSSPNTDKSSISEIKTSDQITGLKRPSEIPFQHRVANKVELIGKVALPVESQELQGGKVAVSVLVQDIYPKLPQFWIPIIFQGELAEIASAHLKQNEIVHIEGQLSGDNPSLKINEGQANVQVLAHSLSYVREDGAEIDVSFNEQKEQKGSHASFYQNKNKKRTTSINASWEDLVANPQNWFDYQMDKQSGQKKQTYPDFKNKVNEEGLWLNAAPEWFLERLNNLKFDNNSKIEGSAFNAPQNTGNYSGGFNSKENLWKDLMENPKDWWDNRINKKTPKSPDFTKKITKEALWLNTAPKWFLESNLNLGNNSASNATKSQNFGPKENLWKDIVENPKDWYDNRTTKKAPNHPDFKHKRNGEVLWVSKNTPQWALSKLPPENFKNGKSSSNFVANNDSDVASISPVSRNTTLLS